MRIRRAPTAARLVLDQLCPKLCPSRPGFSPHRPYVSQLNKRKPLGKVTTYREAFNRVDA